MEMRWLNTTYKEYREFSALYKMDVVRVLQYRFQGGANENYKWGEWKDVPEVHVEA